MIKRATFLFAATLAPALAALLASSLTWRETSSIVGATLFGALAFLSVSNQAVQAAERFFEAQMLASRPKQVIRFLGQIVASLLLLPATMFVAFALDLVVSPITLLAATAVSVALVSTVLTCLRPISEQHLRGTMLSDLNDAKQAAKDVQGEALFFGGVNLPRNVSRLHFALIGVTGSGKSVSMERLLSDVLAGFGPGRDRRMLLYDPKGEFAKWLNSIELPVPQKLIHPFHRDGCAWDIAADFTEPRLAEALAANLVPERKNASGNPFFQNAVRTTIAEVVKSFIAHSPRLWTLADLIVCTESLNTLTPVLARTRKGNALLNSYFAQPRLAGDILSSISTELSAYESVAACWRKARLEGQLFSLTQWLADDQILIMGQDHTSRSALDAINRLLFLRAAQLILSQPDSAQRETWLPFDEVSEAGRLDGLPSIATNGRSKGARLVLGLQSMLGLRDVWGKEQADQLLGQCHSKALLKSADPETAKWQAEVIGDYEADNPNLSESSRGDETFSLHTSVKRAVLPSEFMNLTKASPAAGVSGYYRTAVTPKPHFANVSMKDLLGNRFDPRHDATQKSLPQNVRLLPEPSVTRSIEDQVIPPWNEEDLNRLNLAHAKDVILQDRHVLENVREITRPQRVTIH